jgi:hypothetical protein
MSTPPKLYRDCWFSALATPVDNVCGAGTEWKNGACAATADVCGAGTEWKDGACVATADVCGAGTEWKDGACAATADVCGAGTEWKDGACAATADVCGAGTEWTDGACAATPPPPLWETDEFRAAAMREECRKSEDDSTRCERLPGCQWIVPETPVPDANGYVMAQTTMPHCAATEETKRISEGFQCKVREAYGNDMSKYGADFETTLIPKANEYIATFLA